VRVFGRDYDRLQKEGTKVLSALIAFRELTSVLMVLNTSNEKEQHANRRFADQMDGSVLGITSFANTVPIT
jgi:hypothetical protein